MLCYSQYGLKAKTMMSKELFWNEIEKRWKGEFEMFSQWIDEYKLRPENKPLFNLFRTDIEAVFDTQKGKETTILKFHNLPDAMQIGVFYQYTIETACQYPFVIDENDSIERIKESIKEWFCEEADAAYRDHLEGKYINDVEM